MPFACLWCGAEQRSGGYLNRCLHFSIPINVLPDRFVTSDLITPS